jgi:hypothetical protein
MRLAPSKMIDPFWSMLMHGAASAMARKAELSAQLAALDVEANEAKRRATEQDWVRDQAGRAEELRESRRADPATSMVAHWLGTTEARLDLLLDFANAVVLEGTACFAWYFAGLGAVARGRKAVTSDRNATMSQQEAVAPMSEPPQDSRVGQDATQATAAVETQPVATDERENAVRSEDDLLVEKIHEPVVAGRLKCNLASIRKFLWCGQPKAIRLNRLYLDRFDNARRLARRSD